MLSVIGKIYADMLVDRVRSVTGGLIDEEQGSFRAGKGYVDQILCLIQKDDAGFMNFKEAYDRVNREAIWQVLRIYDVSGKLLNRINSMYVGSQACIRVKSG